MVKAAISRESYINYSLAKIRASYLSGVNYEQNDL